MCLKKTTQVFNTEGEFLLKFGSNGEGNGQFNAPTGVAVDANGNIIVADWGNSRIQVGEGVNTSFLSSLNDLGLNKQRLILTARAASGDSGLG